MRNEGVVLFSYQIGEDVVFFFIKNRIQELGGDLVRELQLHGLPGE